MLNIGDYVLNKTTGTFGTVFGYGHQIIDDVYQPTLKVRVVKGTGIHEKSIVEDLSSKWTRLETGKVEESSQNSFTHWLQDAA